MEPAALATDPHWLEFLAWTATIILCVIAAVALGYTAKQVHEIRVSNGQSAIQAHATFLLELDRRWESTEMHDARTMFYELASYVTKEIEDSHGHLTDSQKAHKSQESFSKVLFDMRNDRLTEYVILMRLCGFLETLGYLIKKDYVSFEDVNSLFGGAAITFDHAFRLHITHRQGEKGVPPGLYEHALSVADMCRSATKPT